MRSMTRCSQCLIPDTRPDTVFIDGVCSACITHARRRYINWREREERLVDLLERYRNPSGYDCIVPSSGGKDSHFQALKLIELGAKPLVVTATTCHLTPIGRLNINNLARYATTIEVTPNQEVRKKLNRIGLNMVGDISWPEHVSIFTTPFTIAARLGIPLIFYGENPQAEYGGPMGTEEAITMTRRWVSEFGGFLGLRPADMIGMDGITEHDMLDYMPPSTDEIEKAGVVAHFLGAYLPWDSRHNAATAIKHGMQTRLPSPRNRWDFENLDNFQTGIHDYLMTLKYGYGRYTAQVSVDIRNGLLTREEAIAIATRADNEFPQEYMGWSLERIMAHANIPMNDLYRAMERFYNRGIAPQPRGATS